MILSIQVTLCLICCQKDPDSSYNNFTSFWAFFLDSVHLTLKFLRFSLYISFLSTWWHLEFEGCFNFWLCMILRIAPCILFCMCVSFSWFFICCIDFLLGPAPATVCEIFLLVHQLSLNLQCQGLIVDDPEHIWKIYLSASSDCHLCIGIWQSHRYFLLWYN